MKGGQAEVWLAKGKKKSADGQRIYYAIKKYSRTIMELDIKRFQDMCKEIKALRSLNQSKDNTFGLNNLVCLNECISTGNSYYLVFTYANGGDLRQFMQYKERIHL